MPSVQQEINKYVWMCGQPFRKQGKHKQRQAGRPKSGVTSGQVTLFMKSHSRCELTCLCPRRNGHPNLLYPWPSHSLAQRAGPWTPCPDRLKAALLDNFKVLFWEVSCVSCCGGSLPNYLPLSFRDPSIKSQHFIPPYWALPSWPRSISLGP